MEEMANIQKLARQALKTFRNTFNGSPVKENLDLLRSMMGEITAQDVKLSPPSKDKQPRNPRTAPVIYIDIIECPYFSMAVFIVDKDRQLPLHDHPGMYGFCKVLYGAIQVDMYGRISSTLQQEITDNTGVVANYDPEYLSMFSTADNEHGNLNGAISDSQKLLKAEKFIYEGKHTFDSTANPCMVTPSHGNVHTIQAINGPAAFLDILGPPYSTEKGRDCLYYKVVPSLDHQSSVRYLQEVPCPQQFFCEPQPYKGPTVSLEDFPPSSEEE